MSATEHPLVRVVRGEVDEDGLAALTAVLLARIVASRSGAAAAAGQGEQARAGWRLPDGSAYRSPASWR